MSPNSTLILRTALVVLTVLAVLGVAWLLVSILEILIIVLISAILATGISPIVTELQERTWTRRRIRLSRGAAILVVYLALLVAFVGLAGIVITPVVIEAQGFVENLPENLRKLELLLKDYQARYPWLPDLSDIVRRLPQEASRATAYFAPAAGVAFRFVGGIITILTVLVLTFYMLLEGRALREAEEQQLPLRDDEAEQHLELPQKQHDRAGNARATDPRRLSGMRRRGRGARVGAEAQRPELLGYCGELAGVRREQFQGAAPGLERGRDVSRLDGTLGLVR